jgi:hypothetical protein
LFAFFENLISAFSGYLHKYAFHRTLIRYVPGNIKGIDGIAVLHT